MKSLDQDKVPVRYDVFSHLLAASLRRLAIRSSFRHTTNRVIFYGLILLLAGCSTTTQQSPPSFKLSAAAGSSNKAKSWKTGEYILPPPYYNLKARYPTTTLSGTWDGISGTVTVTSAPPSRIHDISAACNASDGYAAANSIGQTDDGFSNYMYARFERKSYPWGKAISFLTSSTQNREYSPSNDSLRYEVWGVTQDDRHVVHAVFNTTHAKLPSDSLRAREVTSTNALKNDPDYVLIERSPPQDFQPSLTSIDNIVGSLKMEGKN